MQSPRDLPIIGSVQTPERLPVYESDESRAYPENGGLWALAEQMTWVSGLVLMLSAFTGWYAGSGDGFTIAVIGWHTGVSGKVIFFAGLAVLVIVALREAGVDLPAAIPESLVVILIGSVATIVALFRTFSIPDDFLPADGRGIGLWITLLASIAVIVAGLLRAAEEL
jgi:hypothetical protein